MDKKLQEELYQKFPKIFRDKDESMTKTCMCWGISTGDGWYKIIDALCTELSTYADEKGLDVVAVQVKEKLAGLRFYVVGADEKARQIIDSYEAMSYKICETCGCDGKRQTGGYWLHTMCDTCWAKWQTGWRPWGEPTSVDVLDYMLGNGGPDEDSE